VTSAPPAWTGSVTVNGVNLNANPHAQWYGTCEPSTRYSAAVDPTYAGTFDIDWTDVSDIAQKDTLVSASATIDPTTNSALVVHVDDGGSPYSIFIDDGGNIPTSVQRLPGDWYLIQGQDGQRGQTGTRESSSSLLGAAVGCVRRYYGMATLHGWLAELTDYYTPSTTQFDGEVVAAAVFSSLGSDSRDACEKFFRWAQYNLSVLDPAGHGGDLSSYLTPARRASLLMNLECARIRAEKANAAEATGDHRESIRLWRIIFGEEFPIYG
jgi:hypothetical protein